jgi:hypothetical protein
MSENKQGLDAVDRTGWLCTTCGEWNSGDNETCSNCESLPRGGQ